MTPQGRLRRYLERVEASLDRDHVVRAVDVTAVVVLGAITVASVVASADGFWWRFLAVLAGAGSSLPLLARRTWPLPVAAVVVGMAVVTALLFGYGAAGGGPWLCAVLAAYSVGAYAGAAHALAGILLLSVATLAAGVPKLRAGEDPAQVVTPAGFLVIVWAAGRVAARRRARAAVVEARAADLEARSRQIAQEGAERERERIARELHDAVTHEMTVIVVQAQAAQSLSDVAPERALEAMRAVEESGRNALVEMRRLLGVIRSDAGADRTPQPGLGDIESLVARVRDAGLPLSYAVEGNPTRVPATLGVCAYRIVQESLSNVVRHAGAVATQVRLAVDPNALRVEVENVGGPSVGDPLSGGGRGLAGMRERVAVFRGDLRAGPRPTGGFAVTVVLPLDPG